MSILPLVLASGAGVGPLLVYAPISLFAAVICFVAAYSKNKSEEKTKRKYLNIAGSCLVLSAIYCVFYLFPKELGRF